MNHVGDASAVGALAVDATFRGRHLKDASGDRIARLPRNEHRADGVLIHPHPRKRHSSAFRPAPAANSAEDPCRLEFPTPL